MEPRKFHAIACEYGLVLGVRRYSYLGHLQIQIFNENNEICNVPCTSLLVQSSMGFRSFFKHGKYTQKAAETVE